MLVKPCLRAFLYSFKRLPPKVRDSTPSRWLLESRNRTDSFTLLLSDVLLEDMQALQGFFKRSHGAAPDFSLLDRKSVV